MADAEKPDLSALPEGSVPSTEYAEKVLGSSLEQPNPNAVQTGPQRPEGVPEQFWNAETGKVDYDGLVKSYGELRAKMDAGKSDEEPKVDPAGEPSKDGKIQREEPAAPASIAATFENLAKTYADGGGITPEAVKPLLDLGIPQANIDLYFEGLAAIAERNLSAVHKVAGGEDAFNATVEWARKEMSDKDLAFYNDQIDDPTKRETAVAWLMDQYAKARPSEGKLATDTTVGGASGDVYTAVAQVTADMAKNEYKTDPAFRKKVAEKMLRSRTAGTLAEGTTEFFSRS